MFTLPGSERVSLRVLDVRGRMVATLLDRALGPGRHRIAWDGRAASGGIYFGRLQASARVTTVRIIRLR